MDTTSVNTNEEREKEKGGGEEEEEEEEKKKKKQRQKIHTSLITNHRIEINPITSVQIDMNNFNNETYISPITTTTTTTTIKQLSEKYVKNHPFDSWYIGGLLFMLSVILVLLYANYYRKNTLQILWRRLLIKLNLIHSSSSSSSSPIGSSSKPAIDEILI